MDSNDYKMKDLYVAEKYIGWDSEFKAKKMKATVKKKKKKKKKRKRKEKQQLRNNILCKLPTFRTLYSEYSVIPKSFDISCRNKK